MKAWQRELAIPAPRGNGGMGKTQVPANVLESAGLGGGSSLGLANTCPQVGVTRRPAPRDGQMSDKPQLVPPFAVETCFTENATWRTLTAERGYRAPSQVYAALQASGAVAISTIASRNQKSGSSCLPHGFQRVQKALKPAALPQQAASSSRRSSARCSAYSCSRSGLWIIRRAGCAGRPCRTSRGTPHGQVRQRRR